ncbi:MAG: site-2 protease family protein, partial [Clostridia bacterium]|nr:site-2 protease family protein [Clostridia bacterium]
MLYILLALIMLGVIIFIHEFGHYIVGRLCGIGIVEFAIGMGPKIVSWKRTHKVRGTEGTETISYSLRLLPLGGFCAFVGEDEDNSDPR